MGGGFNSPTPESTSQVLSSYANYLPAVASAVGSTYPGMADNQLNATLGTQPVYDALNLKEQQNYAMPLAQVSQQVASSNANAAANTNLGLLNGVGGQAAQSATNLSKALNPNYNNVIGAASNQATNLMNSYNLGGLSPGEASAAERSMNQSNSGSGNLGLSNNTNTISNAMNYGAAYDAKRAGLNTALNTGANVAGAASPNVSGVNPVNIAMGLGNMNSAAPNPVNNTSAATQGNLTNSANQYGSSVLGGMFGSNNAATSGAYGLASANAVPNYIPNISC